MQEEDFFVEFIGQLPEVGEVLDEALVNDVWACNNPPQVSNRSHDRTHACGSHNLIEHP